MRKSGSGALVRLTEQGVRRVLEGKAGMTFEVDVLTQVRADQHGNKLPKEQWGQLVVHVKDHRFPGTHFPYQIWSLGEGDYTMVREPSQGSGCECCDHRLQHIIRHALNTYQHATPIISVATVMSELEDNLQQWEADWE